MRMETNLFLPQKVHSVFSWAIAIALIAGLFPSLTALSQLHQNYAHYLGPIGPLNFLKVIAPVICVYLCYRLQLFPLKKRWCALFILVIGSIASVISAKLCNFESSSAIREWAAILFGFLCAAGLISLPGRQKISVVSGWIVILLSLAFLDKFYPATIDWLYSNAFDPNTKWFDSETSNARILTGVFGFQSMGKLLSWTPWLLYIFIPKFRASQSRLAWIFLASISTGLILSTTQRGPLLGMGFGWLAFCSHSLLRASDRKIWLPAMLAFLVSLAATWLFTPFEIFEARTSSITNQVEKESLNHEANLATDNVNFRKRMWQLSIFTIIKSPLGNSCIPNEEFTSRGLYSTHSHNLFLQQFRERGWIWGLIHFAIWMGAALMAWQSKQRYASGIFAAIICICVQGMFDHPWFVMNHAMILSVFLISAYCVKQKEFFN